MNFVPSFKVNSIVSSQDIISEFQVANMGGMRRSKKTNTLVIISDETKGLYKDIWHDDVIHYTGMGKIGDQHFNYRQNKVLANSNMNNVNIHLFEVKEATKYIYRGQFVLGEKPYIDYQLDDEGNSRKVWIFPLYKKEKAGSDMLQDYYKMLIDESPINRESVIIKKKLKK